MNSFAQIRLPTQTKNESQPLNFTSMKLALQKLKEKLTLGKQAEPS